MTGLFYCSTPSANSKKVVYTRDRYTLDYKSPMQLLDDWLIAQRKEQLAA